MDECLIFLFNKQYSMNQKVPVLISSWLWKACWYMLVFTLVGSSVRYRIPVFVFLPVHASMSGSHTLKLPPSHLMLTLDASAELRHCGDNTK